MWAVGIMSAKNKRQSQDADETVGGDETLPKSRKVLQRYRDVYHETWPWFTKSQRGEYYVNCTICSSDFMCAHAGKNYCQRHVDSKTHKELSVLQKSNKSMTSFLTNSTPETSHQRAVTRAEEPVN